MKVYFISGLGADARVFDRLELPAHLSVHHVAWIDPLPNESLSAYSARLAKGMDTTEPFYLVGLSFGGIIAAEIAQMRPPKKTILLSTVATHKEMPVLYRLTGALHLHRLVPAYFFNRPTWLTYRFFGLKGKGDRRMLQQILADTPPHFLQWAIDQLLRWRNHQRPQNVFHIHGGCDRLLPAKNTRADLVIPGGGHLVVYTHAGEVSKQLALLLQ